MKTIISAWLRMPTGQHKNNNVKDLVTNPQGDRSIKFRWWTKELVT